MDPSEPKLITDLTFIHQSQKVSKQVPRGTRISAVRSLIARTLGINIRRKKIRIIEVEDAETEIPDGEEGQGQWQGDVVDEGDGGREIGWFVSGRRGVVVID